MAMWLCGYVSKGPKFEHVKVSTFQKFKASTFQNFGISIFQDPKQISKSSGHTHTQTCSKLFKFLDAQISDNNMLGRSFWLLLVCFEVLLHKIREPKSNSWLKSENYQTCH